MFLTRVAVSIGHRHQRQEIDVAPGVGRAAADVLNYCGELTPILVVAMHCSA